jgi:hypothetical protein
MNPFSAGLSVLTAMITPALLISACGTFILSTSNRLGRIVDRVRILSNDLEDLVHGNAGQELMQDRREMMLGQLNTLSERARLLQQGLTAFYIASGVFVFTSVAIGVVSIVSAHYNWIPVVLALSGGGFFFYGSVLMLFEARLALSSLRSETGFLLKLVAFHSKSKL